MAGTIAISLNSKLFTGEEINGASISASDRGLLLGDGLFETLPVLSGTPLWLTDHTDRLMQSAGLLGLELDRSQCETAIAQALTCIKRAPGGNGILRLTITRGSGGRGLLPPQDTSPTIMASLGPFPLSLPFASASLVTSPIRRNETSPTSRIKSLGYQDNILATQQASQNQADDAVFLNSQGKVCCTTICNVFAIKDDHILTPPVEDGLLPGIMRQKLLNLLPMHGIEIRVQSLALEDLHSADGLFLTNSLRIIRPVTRLDNIVYTPHEKPVLKQCQQIAARHIQELTGQNLLTS